MSMPRRVFLRQNVGEQPVLTDVTSPQGEDPCEILGSTHEQNERDALALKLAGLIAKEIIEKNHSIVALTRVIDGCLPAIFSAINEIILGQEPRVTTPTTVQVNIGEPFISQR